MSSSGDMAKTFLAYDVGSTYSKVSAFALNERGLEFLGRAQSPTTLSDIVRGLDSGREALMLPGGDTLDRAVINASSSAAGGLRMAAMGYMPKVTAKAAKEVAMNAGARVLEVLSHEEAPSFRLEVLREIRPDIILLAGGTDGGEAESLLENAALIARAKIPAKVILAGNISAQPEAARIFEEAGVPFARVANVMPTIHDLNVNPARSAIHFEFIRQITRAPGLARLADLVFGGEIAPTPSAILMGAELLAAGTHAQDGAGGLLVLDIGGATTDVHSVIPAMASLKPEERGLVINNDKQVAFRTLEGNLGLRVSAASLVETVGPAAILALRDRLRDIAPRGAAPDEMARLTQYAAHLEAHTDHLPQNEWEDGLEPALAAAALKAALSRHAGYWVTEYNHFLGLPPGSPVGRDLRSVKWVLGVGGFFSHRPPEEGLRVLRAVFEDRGYFLFPENQKFRLDKNYLLYAAGLLGREIPDQTLNFLKKYLEME